MNRLVSRLYRVSAGLLAGYLLATVVRYKVGGVPVMDEAFEMGMMLAIAAFFAVVALVPITPSKAPDRRFGGR